MSNDEGLAALGHDSGIVVIVACMDRRLVEILKLFRDRETPLKVRQERLRSLFNRETEDYKALSGLLAETTPERTLVLTNAGANVKGLSKTLGEIRGISRLVVMTHNDCGGMKVVANGLSNGATEESDELFRHLGGSRYKSAAGNSRDIEEIKERVEMLNPGVQREAARSFCTKVAIVQVDVRGLRQEPEGNEHWLLVAPVGQYPHAFDGTPRWQTYGIVGDKEDEVVDRKIAATLGISCIVDRWPRKISR